MSEYHFSYDVDGTGQHIILLHGWLQTKEVFEDLFNHLIKEFKVFNLDLLGFGKSSMPKKAISILDYALSLHEFIQKNSIVSPIIIGHSFGGRVAIKYASLYPASKVVLVDSAGIKQKRSLKVWFKIYLYKTLKFFKIKTQMGSTDYKNLSDVMKGTMTLALKEDLSKDMKKITVPTLLIWGELDKATPVGDAKKINENIKDSGLVIIPQCGHFPFLENPTYFKIVLDSFLLGGKK